MSDWDTYAEQVRNRFDYETNAWAVTEVNSGAAIYGHDGSKWAVAGDEGELGIYQHPLENPETNTVEQVDVNEHACAMGVWDGNRQPSKAGIRMAGQKFMLKFKDDDAGICTLTRTTGGAVIGKSASAIVVGFWKKDSTMSDGKLQNEDDCFKLVKEMCDYLTEQGF